MFPTVADTLDGVRQAIANVSALANSPEAARSGEIPLSQLDASVLKILKAKASVGLHKARLVDISKVAAEVGRPENLAQGQKIADDAITLVRDNGKLLPLKKTGTTKSSLPYQQLPDVKNRLVVVIFSDDIRTSAGRTFERQHGDREFRGRIEPWGRRSRWLFHRSQQRLRLVGW